MKNLILLSSLWIGTTGYAEITRPAPAFDCPLYAARPAYDPTFDIYLEPIEFLLRPEQGLCDKWKVKLTSFRDKFIAFNRLTLEPVPIDRKAEIDILAAELTDLITSIAIDAQTVLESGKTCQGKEVKQIPKNIFVQLVRSLYASHEQIRNTAQTAGTVMELTKTIPELVKYVTKLHKAEVALRQQRFDTSACNFLEQEYKKRCASRPETGLGQALPAESTASADDLRRNVETRQAANQPLIRTLLEKKTPLDSLTQRLRPNPRQFEDSDAFYDLVVPSMKLCGLQAALQAYPRPKVLGHRMGFGKDPFPSQCEAFLCDEAGLFKPEADANGSAFCRFVDDYRTMEARYFEGFRSFRSATPSQQKRQVGKGAYCPETYTGRATLEGH